MAILRVVRFNSIYIKLEGLNPSGSIKDVPVYYMLLNAENKGLIKPGDTIVEATSGNTGISLAMIGAIKGYKIKIVMPESVSIERRKIIQSYGAELILTPKEKGVDGAIKKAKELSKKYFYLNQYENEYNWKAHYHITGNEILRQTNYKITHFVAGIGTGGTITGVGKRLKEFNENIKIIGVEPVKGHNIQGLKNMEESKKPKIFDESILDEKYYVNDKQAFSTARMLAKNGFFVGMSTGASVYVALKLSKKYKNAFIVAISPDSGYKYLSTNLFSDNND